MEVNWIVVCFVILALVGYLFVQKKYDYWVKRGVPFTRPTFPLGNLWGIGSKKHIATFLEESYNDLKGKDIFGGIYFFTKPVIVPTDLNLIRNILVKDNQYFQGSENCMDEKDNPLSGHLFALTGQQWRNLKNKTCQIFTPKKIKMMFPTITQVTQNLNKCLESATKENQVKMTDILSRFSTDAMGTCIFGVQYDSFKDSKTELHLMAMKNWDLQCNYTICYWFKQMFPKLAHKLRIEVKKFDYSAEAFAEFMRNIIKPKQNNKTKKNDYLSFLLHLKSSDSIDPEDIVLGKMNFQQVVAHTFQVFTAGFQTTLSIMTFALYELAFNQDVQDKARKEIRKVLTDHRELSYEACMELKYLDRILKETLRKYPVVSFLQRQLGYDYPVPESRHMIKKDLWLLVPVYAIHRDPDIYPLPEKFDPDRFTEEKTMKRHPCAWLPFGEGPRRCVGYSLAMQTVRVGLTILLSKYRISPCSKTPTPMVYDPNKLILFSNDEMWLKVSKIYTK